MKQLLTQRIAIGKLTAPVFLLLLLGCCLCSIIGILLVPSKPSATPTSAIIGGIGLDKAAFEHAHPKGYETAYQDDRTTFIEWTHQDPITPEQARREAAALLPADAVLIRTYHPDAVPELTVDLYTSAWLAGRFKTGALGSPWYGGAEPGQFILVFAVNDGKTQRIVLSTGNQP